VSEFRLAVHDAEVIGVENHRDLRQLTLRLRMSDGVDAFLEFLGVESLELGPFREQNVLLDLYVWSASMQGTQERCQEFELPLTWMRAILAGELVLYELDASAGLCGYVIAKEVRGAKGRASDPRVPVYSFR
jgi:hypothetical protein